MLTVLGGLAEFERRLILARTTAFAQNSAATNSEPMQSARFRALKSGQSFLLRRERPLGKQITGH
jgi:DNA invertase Pin-like site-specific DNA recombinase